MKVEKVINNNLVRSLDSRNQEILVMGSGLGFKKKPGDEIDSSKVEKVYHLDTQKEQQDMEIILARAPLEVLQAVNEIVAYGRNSLHTELPRRSPRTIRVSCCRKMKPGLSLCTSSTLPVR